mgnify:CR=1 FL=1|tara:strand:+ start:1733 stop:2050 length:318 start_codon:yes stop_codon:yes gene_type:complete
MAGIDRHEFVKFTTFKGKGTVYNTTRLPSIEKTPQDRYIFTRAGDRLDNLAFDFYKDPRHWIILAIANNLGKGSLDVPPNMQLRIPPQSVITSLRDRYRAAEEER